LIRKLAPILGVTFVDILGFSILIPILPYFVKHFGASTVLVGVLFSTFAACQLIAGPIWGNVSDRYGRKIVLIVSQIGATIGWCMLAFAPNMTVVFVARIIEGLSGGNISVTQAYVADLVEPHEQTRAFAFVNAAFGAGIVFGPAVGGFMLGRFGFAAPFLAAAGLQAVTLLLTIVMLPESRGKEDRTEQAGLHDIIASLRDARVSPLLLQLWMYSLGLYAWFAVFALLLGSALGFGPEKISYCFAGFGVLNVLVQIVAVGRISDALGDRASSNLGLACTVGAFLWVPFIHDLLSLLPTFALFVLGMALSRASLTSLLTKVAPVIRAASKPKPNAIVANVAERAPAYGAPYAWSTAVAGVGMTTPDKLSREELVPRIVPR